MYNHKLSLDTVMKKLLSLPPNLVECFHDVAGVDRKEYFCTSDPVGARLGSGGGTNWLMESDNKPGVFYIALSRFTDRKAKYYIDGVEATPEQVADLKENYLPKPKESTNDKPAIEWLTYLIDNIISVEAV